jgi:hypothetical protein
VTAHALYNCEIGHEPYHMMHLPLINIVAHTTAVADPDSAPHEGLAAGQRYRYVSYDASGGCATTRSRFIQALSKITFFVSLP